MKIHFCCCNHCLTAYDTFRLIRQCVNKGTLIIINEVHVLLRVFQHDIINITYIIDHNVAGRQTCVRKLNPNFDPHLLAQISVEQDSCISTFLSLERILLFMDTSQRTFGTNLSADVLASVQLHLVSITNEFSARVSTRGSVLSFLLRSVPSSSLCPRNYSLPLLFSIVVPLGPSARSSSRCPRVFPTTS